jgi:hypothetical protein
MATDTSFAPAVINTGCVVGDDFSMAFLFYDKDDAIVDITDADAGILLMTSSGTPVMVATLTDGLTIAEVDAGDDVLPIGLHWTIDRVDTAKLSPGILRYKVVIMLDGMRKTRIKGTFVVEA